MFSQDDDSQQRVALLLIFSLVAVVIASVLVFGARRAMAPREAVPTTAVAVMPAPAPSPAPAMPSPPEGIASAPVAMTPAQAAQASSDAASVKVEQGVVKFYFASGKADLAAGAGEALADVVKGAGQGRTLLISGFHDASGDPVKNAALAHQRAVAVQGALKAAGVADKQIELRKPVKFEGSGSDAEARRVEISLQ